MCGRFTLRTPATVLTQQLLLDLGVDQAPDLLEPRYNIAPTQPVAAVRELEAGRRLDLLRWGLIPSWAKDAAIGARTINARAETVAEKPSFRAAFRRRRCLVLADGYYEWRKEGSKKQPYYIRRRDEAPFAFAGLWERWSPGGDDSHVLETCTLITTEANDLTRPIHDRMPVILPAAAYAEWLDPQLDDRPRLLALLRPYDSQILMADPVSTHVNNPKHDDPECVRVVA